MTTDCIFCQIIAHKAPADILYQDERVTAFRDIHPAAPIHILVVPNKHIPSMNEAEAEDEAVLGQMQLVAQKIAREQGIAERGYRLITNVGNEGGQVVYHIHLHLLGGMKLGFTRYI